MQTQGVKQIPYKEETDKQTNVGIEPDGKQVNRETFYRF